MANEEEADLVQARPNVMHVEEELQCVLFENGGEEEGARNTIQPRKPVTVVVVHANLTCHCNSKEVDVRLWRKGHRYNVTCTFLDCVGGKWNTYPHMHRENMQTLHSHQ